MHALVHGSTSGASHKLYIHTDIRAHAHLANDITAPTNCIWGAHPEEPTYLLPCRCKTPAVVI